MYVLLVRRYLQRFWGASGDYWQSKWEWIYELFEGNELLLAITSKP
jgi:hypothetical protein